MPVRDLNTYLWTLCTKSGHCPTFLNILVIVLSIFKFNFTTSGNFKLLFQEQNVLILLFKMEKICVNISLINQPIRGLPLFGHIWRNNLQVKLLSYRKFTSEFSSDLQVHLSVLISVLLSNSNFNSKIWNLDSSF